MRVVMLGWEFPPFISGGLGTACHGLTRAMARLDVGILFMLPTAGGDVQAPGRTVGHAVPAKMTFGAVPSRVASSYGSAGPVAGAEAAQRAATTEEAPLALLDSAGLRVIGTGCGGYEGDLAGRIGEYTTRCLEMLCRESFDVIHAHDWVTYPAGAALAARTGKPLVAHVHSTEFDRSGERINPAVYDIERAGIRSAAAVIAVSNLTRRVVVDRYDVPGEKVRVVHNGMDSDGPPEPRQRAADGRKVVLFLGRITMQKGPEFFVRAAGRVLDRMDNVTFVIAGWGDLAARTIEQVAGLGLGRHVRFTGFLRGGEVARAYALADVYVMPSVSEPFGLTALEAVRHGVPVVVSRSSGVAEVLQRGALKVDFWDVDETANKIVSLLRRPEMADTLRRCAWEELSGLTWDRSARGCLAVYREQVAAGGG